MSLVVYDHHGNKIELISSVKSGGEGTIYLIKGNPIECAKIYHPQKVTAELHGKIMAMVNNPPDDPTWATRKHKSIAWPSAVLYKDSKKTQFIGFIMPFINIKVFQEAHKYYDPSDRLRKFGGGFTWQYLFTAAYNITSAIAALHEKDHCVGDLRETNILVAPFALITLIDCDSFQIKDKDSGKVYYTRVGTGEYLPPELQSADFKGKDYDRYYSDLFALGALIFKFLMQGVHPYQAKGPLVDDAPSTEAKIRKGYFPYGTKYKGVEPPDYASPYDIIPPSIQELFFRCFVEGHKEPQKRPTAKEWFEVLQTEGKRLKECNTNKNHRYSTHLNYCPWCKIAEDTKTDQFPSLFGLGQQIALEDPTSSLESLEKRIDYIRSYITIALADGVLTSEEKEYITEIGLKVQIPTTEIEKAIQEEIKRVGAKVVSLGVGTPLLEISKNYFEFHDVRIGSTVSDTFTIGNAGGGTLSGAITSNKRWLKVSQSSIDTSRHRQDVTMLADTTGLLPGFMDTGKVEIRSNGGVQVVSVGLSTEGYKNALNRFEKELAVAFAFGGGALGSLFGRIGVGGATIFYLALLAALCYLSFSKWSHFWEETYAEGGPIAVLIVISILIGSLYGLAVLCGSVPIAGAIVCGFIASALFAPIFSERLFEHQCSNQAIPSTGPSAIIDLKRKIVRSTAIIAGMLTLLAICAAISLLIFIFTIIVIVIAAIVAVKYFNVTLFDF